ncbi:dihydroneopterin aldolase [Parapedobacter sp. DT-150]|uniref:dihydroneopterin aldolase n=1 Tax=Parapedobacter sp. DT-150 TaxID=3396162 RepID=UPI003F19AAC5
MEKIQQVVALTDLRFYAYHGYYPEEQVLGNEFIMTIRVRFDRQEGDGDQLERTVNYETLYHIAKSEMQQPRKLLETVAESMLNRVRKEFPFVDEIKVSISKNHPPFGGDRAKASVAVVWNR